MPKLLLILTSLPLLSGCETPPPEPTAPPNEEALFCDVVENRAWFTQAEIDDREARGWTRNLAYQYAVNLAWDRECDTGD